jgi:anti-sigma28 factor (negative regulator of flagellin synthesis)
MRILDHWLFKAFPSRAENTRGVKEDLRPSSTPTRTLAAPDARDTVATLNQDKLVSQALQADAASRSELIEQLKAAFESGSYQVDPADLSRALVADALANGEG